MGLYYSTDAGVTWQMATIKDGSQVVQQPLSGANGGSNAATAVVWNPVRQLFYAAVRFHGYYQSADGVTWTRMAAQPGTGLTTGACPPEPYGTGSTNCPIFRGGAGGAAGERGYIRVHGGPQQSGPGDMAGCVRADGIELRDGSELRDAAAVDGAGGGRGEHGDSAGRL